MKLTNPFLRAYLFGAIWFLVIGFNVFQRAKTRWTIQVLLVVSGIVALGWLVTGFIAGFIAVRSEKWRSWWGIGGTTVAASILVMWTGMLIARQLALSPSVPVFKDADERMVYLASTATAWVKKDRGIDLDYSADSIQIIEEELTRISKEVDKASPQKGTFGIAAGYGAYIGEVFRRQAGGTWAVDHPVAGPSSYPLTTTSNGTIFPVGWCWKRLTIGEEDNVYHKARVFLQKQEILPNAIPVK